MIRFYSEWQEITRLSEAERGLMKRLPLILLSLVVFLCLAVVGLGVVAMNSRDTGNAVMQQLEATVTALASQIAGNPGGVITTTPGVNIPVPIYQSTLSAQSNATSGAAYDQWLGVTRTAQASDYQGTAAKVYMTRTAFANGTATARAPK